MPSRPCLACGALTTGSYCPGHGPPRPTRATPGRRDPAAFRAAVLLDAGGRCQAVIDGVRCNVWRPDQLQAHHVVGLRRGGANDPANGVALCRYHHRLADAG